MKTSEIPDFPKIRINNYIARLSDNIRVILDQDIISRYIDNFILDNISSRLGFLKASLNKYIKNKKYPLFFLKELDKIVNADIFNLIEQHNPIFFSKWKQVRLPKFITPKLAYFVGYLQGDGCIESNKRRIDFTDEYSEQINKIYQICLDLFGIKEELKKKDMP